MKSFLHLICDYAPGDLAWAEIIASVEARIPPHVRTHLTSVRSFDTIATGFAVAQLAMAEPPMRPEEMVIFANTAPRKDRHKARKNNAGEGLLYAVLDNGVQVVAVNSGHSLSFVRDHIIELRTTQAPDRGSQFRSRDFFPQIIGQAANGKRSFVRRKLDVQRVVPAIPANVVAYIDSFGNMKTTIRDGDALTASLKTGSRVKVVINGTVRTATVATGSFNVEEGDLAFSPGSSGHAKRYWELFQRGGSAQAEFRGAKTGDFISVVAE
jgi:hypothetical protein